MTTPDVVVIGHVVQDVVPGGWRVGGTATFATAQAQRLGLRAGLVTRVGPDVTLEDVIPKAMLAGRASIRTTRFENVYDGSRRRQRVPVQAERLTMDDVPAGWRSAGIVLMGPVCGEVPAGMATAFSGSLVGVSAQGWLRSLDREHRVRRRAWSGPPFWSGCEVLFVSDEDLGRRRDQLDCWTAEVPMVVVTRNRRGARLQMNGRWQSIEAFPAREVDPTGAGDVFAAAFLVHYHEKGDAAQAIRFASAAAACSVEAVGLEGIATRQEIEARLEEHPEVALR